MEFKYGSKPCTINKEPLTNQFFQWLASMEVWEWGCLGYNCDTNKGLSPEASIW